MGNTAISIVETATAELTAIAITYKTLNVALL